MEMEREINEKERQWARGNGKRDKERRMKGERNRWMGRKERREEGKTRRKG